MFTERTVSRMANPGNIQSHHAETIYDLPSATIEPQAGVGGGIPTPRKLRDASRMITVPTWRVARTIREPATFGKMCLSMMLPLEHPAVLARSTKSLPLTFNVSPG
jgi:hypothetical protein